MDHFKKLDFPKGFTFDDLFTMLNLDGSGGLRRKEFEDGMHRLCFGTEFQRFCQHQLAMGQIKAVHHDTKTAHLERLTSEFANLHAEIRALNRRFDELLSVQCPGAAMSLPPKHNVCDRKAKTTAATVTTAPQQEREGIRLEGGESSTSTLHGCWHALDSESGPTSIEINLGGHSAGVIGNSAAGRSLQSNDNRPTAQKKMGCATRTHGVA